MIKKIEKNHTCGVLYVKILETIISRAS